MTRPSSGITPVCCTYIFLLLSGSFQPVQSIALSSLCGQFGHSCFGGNWGKRDSPIASSTITPLELSQSNTNDDEPPISLAEAEKLMNRYLYQEIQLNLLRHRLRQLFELE